jgi:hypothetical protein
MAVKNIREFTQSIMLISFCIWGFSIDTRGTA